MRLKNFEETGTLEHCVRVTHHHAQPNAFVFAPTAQAHQQGWQRIGSIADGLKKALLQIGKIRRLAYSDKDKYEELIKLLDEEFEFGLPGKE